MTGLGLHNQPAHGNSSFRLQNKTRREPAIFGRGKACRIPPNLKYLRQLSMKINFASESNVVDIRHLALIWRDVTEFLAHRECSDLFVLTGEQAPYRFVSRVNIAGFRLTPVMYKPVALKLDQLCFVVIVEPVPDRKRRL